MPFYFRNKNQKLKKFVSDSLNTNMVFLRNRDGRYKVIDSLELQNIESGKSKYVFINEKNEYYPCSAKDLELYNKVNGKYIKLSDIAIIPPIDINKGSYSIIKPVENDFLLIRTPILVSKKLFLEKVLNLELLYNVYPYDTYNSIKYRNCDFSSKYDFIGVSFTPLNQDTAFFNLSNLDKSISKSKYIRDFGLNSAEKELIDFFNNFEDNDLFYLDFMITIIKDSSLFNSLTNLISSGENLNNWSIENQSTIIDKAISLDDMILCIQPCSYSWNTEKIPYSESYDIENHLLRLPEEAFCDYSQFAEAPTYQLKTTDELYKVLDDIEKNKNDFLNTICEKYTYLDRESIDIDQVTLNVLYRTNINNSSSKFKDFQIEKDSPVPVFPRKEEATEDVSFILDTYYFTMHIQGLDINPIITKDFKLMDGIPFMEKILDMLEDEDYNPFS